MAQIVRYGAYLPRHRISVKEIQDFYGRPGRPRSRTLATPGLDEDPLTMAYEASVATIGHDGAELGALIVASQAPPFGLRKFSATLARALGVSGADHFDLGAHPAGLLDGLALADALVAAGRGPVLVVASDHLVAYEERVADMLSAGGAAAFLIGGDGGVAELGAERRASEEVFDVWRLGTEPEARYRLEVLFGTYGAVAKTALAALEEATGRPAGDYASVAASQPHPQTLRALGRLGVGKEQLAGTSFVGEIGNLGTASAGFALALALDAAEAGQHVLAFGYGGGEGIAREIEVTAATPDSGAAGMIEGQAISLSTYYRWTRGRQVEPH